MAYPSFRVIDSASPPVSPTVVAKILTTQNASVTLGTLLKATVLAATLALLGGSPRTRGQGLRQKSHWEGTLDFSS
jgi:hypothetical protein